MKKNFLSKGAMIAAVSAVAIMLAVAGGASAQTKKSAKMAAPPPPPPAPGFCTAKVNELKWGNMSYRTQSGEVVPTLAVCYDTHCPAQC